ncbi:MAG: tetratricopeptide repeat protein [Bdellovibrionales bacterium]
MIRSQHRSKAQKYMDGDGVDLDPEKAVQILIQGADSGDLGCFFDLAEAFLDGVPEDDPEKAVKYLEAAGNNGHGKSCAMLSELYTTGTVAFAAEDIVRPNAERSFEWARLGAEAGDPECLVKMSQFLLANDDKAMAEIYLKKCLSLDAQEVPEYKAKEVEKIQGDAQSLLSQNF